MLIIGQLCDDGIHLGDRVAGFVRHLRRARFFTAREDGQEENPGVRRFDPDGFDDFGYSSGDPTCNVRKCNYSNHMSSILKLVAIGNSQGVRLPKALLTRYHFETEIEAVETPDGVLLKPMRDDKLSWEEGFRQAAVENQTEIEAWEGTLGDGLEPEEFEGWPR